MSVASGPRALSSLCRLTPWYYARVGETAEDGTRGHTHTLHHTSQQSGRRTVARHLVRAESLHPVSSMRRIKAFVTRRLYHICYYTELQMPGRRASRACWLAPISRDSAGAAAVAGAGAALNTHRVVVYGT